MPRKKIINKELLDLAKHIDHNVLLESIKNGFSDIEDPRVDGRVKYPAWFLLLVIISGFLAGCDDIQDLAYFVDLRREWFKNLLGKNYGAPSYDTLWWFLARLKPDTLKQLLQQWFSNLPPEMKRQVLALDGKRLRGGGFLGEPVHLVELFATESGLTLYTTKVPEKQGESKVLPEILEAVDVTGSIVSGDALYTNTKVAQQIIDAGTDYILALKGNQEHLNAEAINFFNQLKQVDLSDAGAEEFFTTEDGHGRHEERRVLVTSELDWLPQLSDWPELKTLVAVDSKRVVGDKTTTETRYYISSCISSAKEFSSWIRSHWAIENNLHWVADVVFREDTKKSTAGYSAENLGIVRRCVMNIVKICDPGQSLVNARRTATHASDYLTGMLVRLFVK